MKRTRRYIVAPAIGLDLNLVSPIFFPYQNQNSRPEVRTLWATHKALMSFRKLSGLVRVSPLPDVVIAIRVALLVHPAFVVQH